MPLIRLITSYYFPFSANGSQLLTRCLLGFSRNLPTGIKFSLPTLPNQHIALSSGIPQGSGVGPTQSIAYTEDTTSIFPSQYPVSLVRRWQSYGHCSIPDIPDLIFHLQECIKDLTRSYASHRLQLHPSKSEFIWFGSRSSLSKIPSEFHSLTVSGITIHSSKSVRDLGVFLDSELQVKVHVNKLVSICYYLTDSVTIFDDSSNCEVLCLRT